MLQFPSYGDEQCTVADRCVSGATGKQDAAHSCARLSLLPRLLTCLENNNNISVCLMLAVRSSGRGKNCNVDFLSDVNSLGRGKSCNVGFLSNTKIELACNASGERWSTVPQLAEPVCTVPGEKVDLVSAS